MSLVTLGSVAYNPYNTTLAEMAVTGMKLGMENLDRMEENDRFSLSETSKAFAAVTDNLFKGQEMQLRGREADRMDRSQAFHEYEFGQKMAFDEKRAAIGDNQWLRGYELDVKQFGDTQKRTALAEKDFGLREREFANTDALFKEGTTRRAVENAAAIRDALEKPFKEGLEKADARREGLVKSYSEQRKSTQELHKALLANINAAVGYQTASVQSGGGSSNAFESSSTITGAAPAATPGPPTGGGTVAPTTIQDSLAAAENIVGGAQQRRSKSYDPAYIKDMVEKAQQLDALEAQLAQIELSLQDDPMYLGSEAYKGHVGRLNAMREKAQKDHPELSGKGDGKTNAAGAGD